MTDNKPSKKLQQKAFEIYQLALDMDIEERESYLAEAIVDNEALQSAVTKLLDSAEQAEQQFFLHTPAADIKQMGLADELACDQTPLPLPRPIKQYTPIKLIGEGGFGRVYLAEQSEPVSRKVALKLIRHDLVDQKFIKRFETEWQMLAVLNHPNIAHIFDAGTGDDGTPFLAMEYVEGINLTEYCNQHQLGIRQRLTLFLQVCYAIQHAHQKGVIHRDLKPENVIVTEYQGQPVPKVIDFGIAKVMDLKLNGKTMVNSAEFFGSPSYMSPEQIQQLELDIDTRSDVYGLGILLYELLVGSTPFVSDDSLMSLMNQILSETPLRPSVMIEQVADDKKTNMGKTSIAVIKKNLQDDLDWIILKALEKSREQRYATTSALVDDINHFLVDEPVVARAPTVAYRANKFVHRHTLGVIASTAILVVLLAGIVGTSHGYVNAKQESVKARQAEAIAVEQTEIAQQTVALLLEFLSAADPGNKGRELKVVQLLDAFIPRLQELKQQPVLQASLLYTYAKTYHGLGLFSEALDFADKAVSMRKITLGINHPDYFEALNLKINTLWEMGKHQAAEKWGRIAITQASANLGEEHPLTLEAMSATADVLKELGLYSEAEALHRQTLEKRRHILGNDHLDTVHSMARLAVSLGYQDKTTEAVELNRKVLETRTRLLGADHPKTLNTMNNLAFALTESGDMDAGAELHRATFKKRRIILGKEHPETLTSMANLAWTLNAHGKHAEAEAMYRQSITIESRVLGELHPNILITLGNLANSIMKQGRLDEAEKIHLEALQKRQSVHGKQHPSSQASMNDLAGLYLTKKEFEKARDLYTALLNIRRKRLGMEHHATHKTIDKLVLSLVELKEYKPAIILLHESQTVKRKLLGNDHPATVAANEKLDKLYTIQTNESTPL